MDPISQAFVGANFSQLGQPEKSEKTAFKTVLFLGILSGMAPDLDVFIRSSSDPLLALEFHRQFTHSLLFAPIGGLICAVSLYWFVKRFVSFKQAYWYCFLGYFSHGLLDACTAYGTLLFWPFSHLRVSWNNVSIIDPLFTLPLIFFVLLSVIKKRKKIAIYGFIYAMFYLGLGVVQHYRVEHKITEIIKQRGHQSQHINTFPTFANLLVWRTIYTYEDKYYVDAIRAGTGFNVYEGGAVEKLDINKHFPWLNKNTQQYKDIQRFNWFNQGYSVVDQKENDSGSVIDLRYSIHPNGLDGMWGIFISKNKAEEAHVDFVRTPSRKERMSSGFSMLWDMITGEY